MAKGHYIIEGWRNGSNVHWATARTRAAVRRHVERSVVDEGATVTHVIYYSDDRPRGVEVAQVTNALIWKWSDNPAARAVYCVIFA